MSYSTKNINSSATLGVFVKNQGSGIPGLSPTVEIRRVRDSKYLDFNATTIPYWVNSGGQRTKVLPAMPWFDGLYQWQFDQNLYDHDATEDYEIVYRNDPPYKLESTEIISFTTVEIGSGSIENIWSVPMTPNGVQASNIMNMTWAMIKGRMELGGLNQVNVFNDDGTFMYSIQLTPTERTTSNLMAGNLPTYGSAGRYQPNTNPDPELCMVYGVLRYPTGEVVVGNDIEVYIDEKDLPRFAQHYLLSGKIVVARTDENGYFQMDLIRNALVTLHIKQSKFQCQFMVPDLDEIAIENIPGVYGVLKETENQF